VDFNADPTMATRSTSTSRRTNGLTAGTIIACGDMTAKNKKHPLQASGLKKEEAAPVAGARAEVGRARPRRRPPAAVRWLASSWP